MRNPPDVPGVRSQRTRFQKLLAYLKRYWFLYLLVLPGFVFMIVFNYGPMYGIQLAFKDYHANLGIWGSPWVGLEHFREMIADANFWRAAKNTLIINGYNIVFKTTFTIFLALMPEKGQKLRADGGLSAVFPVLGHFCRSGAGVSGVPVFLRQQRRRDQSGHHVFRR